MMDDGLVMSFCMHACTFIFMMKSVKKSVWCDEIVYTKFVFLLHPCVFLSTGNFAA